MLSFFLMTYPSFEVGLSFKVLTFAELTASVSPAWRGTDIWNDMRMLRCSTDVPKCLLLKTVVAREMLCCCKWLEKTVIKFRYYVLVPKVSEYFLYQMYYSERAVWRIWTVWFEKQVKTWVGQTQGQKAIYVNTASKKDLIYAKPIGYKWIHETE
jgi:hypothetical protein